jgi:hypothetical protein
MRGLKSRPGAPPQVRFVAHRESYGGSTTHRPSGDRTLGPLQLTCDGPCRIQRVWPSKEARGTAARRRGPANASRRGRLPGFGSADSPRNCANTQTDRSACLGGLERDCYTTCGLRIRPDRQLPGVGCVKGPSARRGGLSRQGGRSRRLTRGLRAVDLSRELGPSRRSWGLFGLAYQDGTRRGPKISLSAE